jgi:hypothetical protein
VKTREYSYFLFIEAWLRAHWLALPIILTLPIILIALRHYGSRTATRLAN